MRWKTPSYGDVRVVTKFALIPIQADQECRWLEFVKFSQVYKYDGWNNCRFID